MALRARLTSVPEVQKDWPWHRVRSSSLPASLLFSRHRRMEAENFLASGSGIRSAIELKQSGWSRLGDISRIWQPSRLKGIQVSPTFGTPFLAATQVFDIHPMPRKWLSLNRTSNYKERFVSQKTILLTCSGNVGRATLAYAKTDGALISHDLMRIEASEPSWWGWIYAYLRAQTVREMMKAAQYGHIIKHLEVGHLENLPIPVLRRSLLEMFLSRAKSLLDNRNRAVDLEVRAEQLFAGAIGEVQWKEDPEIGFTVRGSDVFRWRRRLEANYWTPAATAIVKHFSQVGLKVTSLSDVSERVWWMTRFKRVFGDDGDVPYMSADELFSLNDPIKKRVVLEQTDKPENYFVKAGWILMACSGQTYGLNGSVALMTKKHEGVFFSHDLVRIIPKDDTIRGGYLFTALAHPRLGRPLVIRNAYGTSVPHLEPIDIASFPVVRLDRELEAEIADIMDEAVRLRTQADEIEEQIAADAEECLNRFMSGERLDVEN